MAESILDRLVNSAHHLAMEDEATDPTNAPAAPTPPASDEPPHRAGNAPLHPTRLPEPRHPPRPRGSATHLLLANLPGQAKRRPATGPVLVEIDHVWLSSHGRPAGRVWLVRLRRGPRTVTVASGLGHTSAESLAAQITPVLPTPSATPGAAID